MHSIHIPVFYSLKRLQIWHFYYNLCAWNSLLFILSMGCDLLCWFFFLLSARSACSASRKHQPQICILQSENKKGLTKKKTVGFYATKLPGSDQTELYLPKMHYKATQALGWWQTHFPLEALCMHTLLKHLILKTQILYLILAAAYTSFHTPSLVSAFPVCANSQYTREALG